MKHLRNKLLLILLLMAASASSIVASPHLHSLDIRVVLSRNGDARITETRQMDIDSEGTECYIGLGNMGGSEVRDLQVSDENGTAFENVGSWDIDRSRSWKAGKCGIVYKHDGYELCWGLGDSGSRTYVTSYTVTSLVHAHPDADAIRHVFLDEDVSPKPEKARVTIEAEDSILFSEDNCGVWGFRFGGEAGFSDGKILVYNTEDFGSRGALYIMVRFDKGMFEPAIRDDDTFEHKKELAFEGSDYASGDDMTTEDALILIALVVGFCIVPVVALIWHFIYVWRARRKVNKDLLWYRDIPMNGNLQQANDVLNAYKYFGTDYNNLLSACILKLIDMGAISIEQTLDGKGKTVQNFVIHKLQDYERQPLLLRKIHSMFKTAAGEDTILEPRELRAFMRSSKNQSITESFIGTLHTKTSIAYYKERQDDVRQLFGLRKFLKEFSLLDERHVQEVTLWKDYMIYATLFGIADQVIRDMKKINPEYFNMDQTAAQMANDSTLPVIYSTLHSGTSRAVAEKAAREARASGHGGHSSWGGGGGGFSGGGFGGGVR